MLSFCYSVGDLSVPTVFSQPFTSCKMPSNREQACSYLATKIINKINVTYNLSLSHLFNYFRSYIKSRHHVSIECPLFPNIKANWNAAQRKKEILIADSKWQIVNLVSAFSR